MGILQARALRKRAYVNWKTLFPDGKDENFTHFALKAITSSWSKAVKKGAVRVKAKVSESIKSLIASGIRFPSIQSELTKEEIEAIDKEIAN